MTCDIKSQETESPGKNNSYNLLHNVDFISYRKYSLNESFNFSVFKGGDIHGQKES